MGGSWIERVQRRLCLWFGHWTYIDYKSKGGGNPEICRCCSALISTAYSRDKGKNLNGDPR